MSIEERLDNLINSGDLSALHTTFLKEVKAELVRRQRDIIRQQELAASSYRDALETIPYDRLAD